MGHNFIKKALSAFTSGVIAVTSMTFGVNLAASAGETEPEKIDDVYQISNADELMWFRDYVNSNTDGSNEANAVLTDDIVVNKNILNSDGSLNENAEYTDWLPIGCCRNLAKPGVNVKYKGTFDGNGHTISGLCITNKDDDLYYRYTGLFGQCDSATIKNLGIVDSYFNVKEMVGAICGYANKSTITNCYNESTIIASSTFQAAAGGICGQVTDCNVSECHNSGSISGAEGRMVGGICGYNRISAYLATAYTKSIVSNCYNTGKITSAGNNVGGICGSSGGLIENCFNIGKVTGVKYVGGIAGVKGKTDNSYYLENCVNGECVEKYSDSGEPKTKEQFESGEVSELTGIDVVIHIEDDFSSEIDSSSAADSSSKVESSSQAESSSKVDSSSKIDSSSKTESSSSMIDSSSKAESSSQLESSSKVDSSSTADEVIYQDGKIMAQKVKNQDKYRTFL
ncbi:MAG: hypothetical protein ACI4RN_02810, partial [Oscillospiraceae bacterium]